MRIDLFLLGAVFYRIDAARSTEALELLRAFSLSPKGVKRSRKTGELFFCLSGRGGRRFESAAAAAELPFLRIREGGVPRLWKRLCARPGLLCGIVLGVILLLAARLFVWDVRVLDVAGSSAEQLQAELANVGLYPGRFLPTLDRDEVAFSLRRENPSLSFVAVNVKGTVAYVQVRESVPAPEQAQRLPANLVASRDGVITLPLIFEGECLVSPGDVVRAGDVLAGGLIDTQNHGYRVTRAAGQVFAKTTRQIRVSVPFAYEKEEVCGQRLAEFSLLFFNFSQKVLKSTGNPIDNCDIIKENIWLTLPGGQRLPFGYSKALAVSYTLLPQKRGALEARQTAFALLEQQIAAQCADATILQKSTEVCVTGEGIELLCTLICEEDIAATSEFSVEP